jgi:hypothetical protein
VIHAAPTQHPKGRSSLMQHRSLSGLFRKRLDGPAQELLEPEGDLIGTFDAVTKYPSVRETSITLTALGILLPFTGLINGQSLDAMLPAGLMVAALGVVGLVVCGLTGSRPVMFAVTTRGFVECRVDILGRPRSILSRSPATAPELLHRAWGWRKIALGDTTVWVKYRLDPILNRMRGQPGPRG